MGRQPTVRRAWLWAPVVLYMAAIFHFSSQSDPMPALTEHVWDKILHTVEYVGLTVLLFRGLWGEGVTVWQAAIATVLLVSAYGASDEWHQSFVPMRSPDVFDWLTDTLAGAIGAAACGFVVIKRGLNKP
jgi:VanZ family protein